MPSPEFPSLEKKLCSCLDTLTIFINLNINELISQSFWSFNIYIKEHVKSWLSFWSSKKIKNLKRNKNRYLPTLLSNFEISHNLKHNYYFGRPK